LRENFVTMPKRQPRRRAKHRDPSKHRVAQTHLDTATPLANMRQARTLRQDQMADLLLCSQQTYSRYESGDLPVPPDQRARIATLLGTSEDVLWPATTTPKQQQRPRRRPVVPAA